MLFTSLDFFLFLGAALLVFAKLPAAARPAWLLLASVFFYGWGAPSRLPWLAATIVLTVTVAWRIRSAGSDAARRAWLAAGLAIVIGTLAAAKFYDFFAGELERIAASQDLRVAIPRIGIVAPAGFSFYAFSASAFLVDTFRREPLPASALDTGLYLAWFPKILAGPIERPTAFVPRLRERIAPTPQQIVIAAQLVGWGLVKKVVVADNLAPLVDRAYGIPAFASPVDLLVATYLFAFQIYCDFSGYTDIAIGVSMLFGLPLAENFRRPYFARGPGEFWSQRWHISLGRWFRDYLYFPLGGSRAGAWRSALNIMLVFAASGLWHAGLGYGVGWTFLVWGALNGAYVVAGRLSAPAWRRVGARMPRLAGSRMLAFARVVLTFHLVALGWVFFRARSLHDAWLVLSRIGAQVAQLPGLVLHYGFTPEHWFAFGAIGALLVVEAFDESKPVLGRMARWPVALRWTAWYAAIAALLVAGRWSAREFIYMQF